MGFYKVKCKKCDEQWEVMVPYEQLEGMTCGQRDYYGRPLQWRGDTREETIENTEGCGNVVERILELKPFAIAGASLDTHGVHNVNGYYSHAFGRYFKNEYAKEEYAERNGFKKVTQAQCDEKMHSQAQKLQAKDDISKKWTENLKAAGGDKIEAAAKTFVPKNMQDK